MEYWRSSFIPCNSYLLFLNIGILSFIPLSVCFTKFILLSFTKVILAVVNVFNYLKLVFRTITILNLEFFYRIEFWTSFFQTVTLWVFTFHTFEFRMSLLETLELNVIIPKIFEFGLSSHQWFEFWMASLQTFEFQMS